VPGGFINVRTATGLAYFQALSDMPQRKAGKNYPLERLNCNGRAQRCGCPEIENPVW
jgi:hypothetical protein